MDFESLIAKKREDAHLNDPICFVNTVDAGVLKYKQETSLGVMSLRTGEVYGPYTLSIQADFTKYCDPKEWFEDLEDYSTVEIAIIYEGDLRTAAELGIEDPEIREYHKNDIIAEQVPWNIVYKIREWLLYRALKETRRG